MTSSQYAATNTSITQLSVWLSRLAALASVRPLCCEIACHALSSWTSAGDAEHAVPAGDSYATASVAVAGAAASAVSTAGTAAVAAGGAGDAGKGGADPSLASSLDVAVEKLPERAREAGRALVAAAAGLAARIPPPTSSIPSGKQVGGCVGQTFRGTLLWEDVADSVYRTVF